MAYFWSGFSCGRVLGRRVQQEADRDDEVAALVDEGLQVRLEVGLARGLQDLALHTELLLGPDEAVVGGLVEGAVVHATGVGHLAGDDAARRRRPSLLDSLAAALVVLGGACASDHRCGEGQGGQSASIVGSLVLPPW